MENSQKEYRPAFKGIKALIRKVKVEEPYRLETLKSKRPKKKICDITGLPTIYTCKRTGLNYFNKDVYEYIRNLKAEDVQLYLDLKNFDRELKNFDTNLP
ncbi:Chromatin-remodeling complex subunit ies6 [Dictyocoela muelleri]|nr:Chromatin-remodeling complex subunit ies6 [Dictyocoela muelleri]